MFDDIISIVRRLAWQCVILTGSESPEGGIELHGKVETSTLLLPSAPLEMFETRKSCSVQPSGVW